MRILCCICKDQAIQMIEFKFVCDSKYCITEALK
jgi:hypothetical protein